MDYVQHPIKSTTNYFARLNHFFGWKFVTMMSVMYFLVKGLLYNVTNHIQLPFCKKVLNVNGSQCQILGVIAGTPWTMKGFWGVLSDLYPLFGYHKNSYIFISAGISTVAVTGLAISGNLSYSTACVLFLAANLEAAVADLLCEGKFSSRMRERPQSGSTMVTFVWGCFFTG